MIEFPEPGVRRTKGSSETGCPFDFLDLLDLVKSYENPKKSEKNFQPMVRGSLGTPRVATVPRTFLVRDPLGKSEGRDRPQKGGSPETSLEPTLWPL